MKSPAIILVVLTMIFFCTGCEVTGQFLKGSGVIVMADRDVSDFNQVDVSVPVNLLIEQGEGESLEITGDDNILPRIKTEVADGKLKIFFQDSVFTSMSPSKKLEIHLMVKELNAITLSGSGDIRANDIKTESLSVTISGSADTVINNLNAHTLEITVSGSGSFKISGQVDMQTINISGSGDYLAKDLESGECLITVSGSGNATINVRHRIDVKISGSGDVRYIGEPMVIQIIQGSGSIEKVDE